MAKPVVLTDDEILVIPYTSYSSCVFKYNHVDDSWSEWAQYPECLESLTHSAVLGPQHLFLFGYSGKVIQIDIETRAVVESSTFLHSGDHSALLHKDGELHIFGGWEDRSHWIFAHGMCILQHSFDGSALCEHLEQSQLAWHNIHPMSNNKVLFVLHNARKIFSYCMRSSECRALDVTLPPTCNDYDTLPCSVLPADEHFLIILGSQRSIFVLDLKLMTLRRSRVLCPIRSKFHAVSVHSEQKDERLVFGFIRQAWRLPAFDELQRLPLYMMNLIALWFHRETIHLFGDGLDGQGWAMRQCKPHWSINVDDVLN